MYRKASGIIGGLGSLADERYMYPANTIVFALLVIMVVYMLGS